MVSEFNIVQCLGNLEIYDSQAQESRQANCSSNRNQSFLNEDSQMQQAQELSKGKLVRVHSDTSSIQNVLRQYQEQKKEVDVRKQFQRKVDPNKLVRYCGPLQQSQETPDIVVIHKNLIQDKFRFQQKIQDIAQGYQGSQISVKGNNVSVSSAHNPNGSVNNMSHSKQFYVLIVIQPPNRS